MLSFVFVYLNASVRHRIIAMERAVQSKNSNNNSCSRAQSSSDFHIHVQNLCAIEICIYAGCDMYNTKAKYVSDVTLFRLSICFTVRFSAFQRLLCVCLHYISFRFVWFCLAEF